MGVAPAQELGQPPGLHDMVEVVRIGNGKLPSGGSAGAAFRESVQDQVGRLPGRGIAADALERGEALGTVLVPVADAPQGVLAARMAAVEVGHPSGAVASSRSSWRLKKSCRYAALQVCVVPEL